MPSALGQDFGSNGPLWSLSYEIVYYGAYPLWLLVRKRSALMAYSLGIVLAILGSYFIPSNFIGNVLGHYPIWLCGAATAEWSTNRNRFHASSFIVGSFGLASFIVAFVGLHIPERNPVKLFLYAILGSSAVLTFLKLPMNVWHLPLHKFFERLGQRSYTIYICHFPMVTLASAWIIQTQGSRHGGGWLAVSVFFGSLLLCNLCFYLCEYHFLHTRIKPNALYEPF